MCLKHHLLVGDTFCYVWNCSAPCTNIVAFLNFIIFIHEPTSLTPTGLVRGCQPGSANYFKIIIDWSIRWHMCINYNPSLNCLDLEAWRIKDSSLLETEPMRSKTQELFVTTFPTMWRKAVWSESEWNQHPEWYRWNAEDETVVIFLLLDLIFPKALS